MISLLLFALIIVQDSIPYKPFEEFEISLEYEFKKHPVPNATEMLLNEANGRHKKVTDSSPLPFIVLNLKVLEACDQEIRLKVFKLDKWIETR